MEPELESLFAPESVAVVGASPDSWYASNLIENLTNYGYDGDLYFVNPSRETVWGEPCYDSITEIPETVDLVVVNVPREYVIDTVREAGEMGVPSALVITAGFGETDEEGADLEVQLGDVGESYGMAICGPNTIGIANTHDETVITSTCSRKPEKGSIGLVSQSGALAFTTFYERAADEDIGFAYIAATGNEAGLSITDYMDFMADSDRVCVICAYIEGVEEPRRFVERAGEIVRNGTPVLATKVGRSARSAQASLSHTGSVTGDAAAWDAGFSRAGIERAPDIPDLIGRARAHTAFDPPSGANVCIASTSGGLASLLADLADERGLSLPALDGETEGALLDMEELLTFGELHNPADIRGYGADVLPEIAEVVFADDAFDAYVFAVGLPAVGERAESIADAMLEVRTMADDPVFFLWTGRKAGERDNGRDTSLPYERVRAGTPLYYDPGRCLDALSSLVRFGEQRSRRSGPSLIDTEKVETPSLPTERVLTWEEATTLLESVGVESVETRLATSPEESRRYAESMGGPVVLKVDSRELPHRSDAGAVALDVTPEEVADQYERLVEIARQSLSAGERTDEAWIEGVLVQKQADLESAVEVLVGISTDEGFGPVLTVAPGGEFVELFGPSAGITLLPPVDEESIRAAMSDSPLGDLLSGYRGEPAKDVDALAALVKQVGDLAVGTRDPAISELDLNPVIVSPEGVSVVDVLVRTGSSNG